MIWFRARAWQSIKSAASHQRKIRSHTFRGHQGRFSLPVGRPASQGVVLRPAGRLDAVRTRPRRKSLPIFGSH